MSRLEIRLPGVVLRGRPAHGSPIEGFYVGKNGWKGWDDSTAGRRNAVPRPAMHGEFDLPVFRSSRVLTIDGHAFAKSEYDLGKLRALWTGIGADGDLVPIQARHQGEFLRAAGRVITATFNDAGYESRLLRADVSLELICADPRKYGLLRHFTGNPAEVFHLGNFPAQSKITVSGVAASGYTVTGPGGRRVVVSKPLTAGAPHVIDFAVGGLFVGGARQTGAVTIWEPWAVPAGTPVTVSVTGGLTLAVELYDTFI